MKIAVVKLSALGDIVHAMVALQFIKKNYPTAQIDWIVEQRFKAVLEHNPDINHIHAVQIQALKRQKSWAGLLDEIKKLRQLGPYDLVVDAQGLIKSAIVAKLLQSKKIAGFDRHSIRESAASWFYQHKVNIPYHDNTIDRNVAVCCQPLDISVSHQEIVEKQPFLFYQSRFQVPEAPYLVFIIGSTWESRCYPKEKFVQVANGLKQTCWVAWGNAQEREKAEWMAKQSNYIKVLPKLSLDDLKKVIDHCDLLIGNDTGPTHMAWGLNRPSITLFGPTPVNRIYQTRINKAIKSASKVDHYALDKNDFSINTIDPAQVIETALSLMAYE
ncbi:lipopolysaccharide heptosyltransferase I [methane-oxidizing endosymbiont of Gigantopelta aegis]|uniref:lipopolysaccharide heptosyltransferase I n=1 Tax=methane-oxidizing endosymbiont of Gigantopelta aegis TaxID=2794938 RepID=UPI0018DC964D|nr:lipopolysaccharide heptosyltransferase I [methane-oxidizing endosymbiont of Gigantopelta aegis]